MTRFGGLSAGFRYSYLAFDQTFKSTLDNNSPLREELDADYEAISVKREMTKNVPTLEANFATRRDFLDIQVGATLGMLYLPDMPMIQHNFDAPVSIGTDDSLMLKFLLEIVL